MCQYLISVGYRYGRHGKNVTQSEVSRGIKPSLWYLKGRGPFGVLKSTREIVFDLFCIKRFLGLVKGSGAMTNIINWEGYHILWKVSQAWKVRQIWYVYKKGIWTSGQSIWLYYITTPTTTNTTTRKERGNKTIRHR